MAGIQIATLQQLDFDNGVMAKAAELNVAPWELTEEERQQIHDAVVVASRADRLTMWYGYTLPV